MTHPAFLPKSKCCGLTLIELLAAAGIMAVLAALLFPAITTMRERANAATCVSNLHKMGGALAGYIADNDNYLPGNNMKDTKGRWYLSLNPYLEKNEGSEENGWGRPSVFICPSNDRRQSMGKYAIFEDVGYLCNLQLMPRCNNPKEGPPFTWSNGTGPIRANRLPSNVVLFADNAKGAGSSNYWVFLRNAGEIRSNRPYIGGGSDDPHSIARIHGDGVNALFTDYSVRFMKAEDINRPGREIETGAYFRGVD